MFMLVESENDLLEWINFSGVYMDFMDVLFFIGIWVIFKGIKIRWFLIWSMVISVGWWVREVGKWVW